MRHTGLVFPELRLRIVSVQREGRQLKWTLKDVDDGTKYYYSTGSKTGPNLQQMLHLRPDESIDNPESFIGTIIPASLGQFDIRVRQGSNHHPNPMYVKSEGPVINNFVADLEVF